MCGIAGVVGIQGDHSQDVRVMCDAMRHRGPDDAGYFDAPGVHLGMRRLAIIDVAHGAQPMVNEDASVVTVFNGEIYNYPNLQKQLRARGHRMETDSDTECLVHLYEDHGPQLVDQLRGMFAVALWDRASETLLLARDRLGKKPLYYYQDGPRLWFASELKCLLALTSTPRSVDPEAIYRYLTYKYVPNPLSVIAGVKKLPPAHRLTWRHGRVTVERYWSLEYAPLGRIPTVPEEVLGEQLRAHLLDATRIRMISERPLGAFLSGGLDSSAVVAAMARLSPEPIRTFSIGFDHEAFNELPHARRVSELYGTKHQELIVEPHVVDVLPRIARAYDEPFADTSAVPTHYVAEMTRRDVVVALNGDGGDEALGGYTTYLNFQKVPPDRKLSPSLVSALRRVSALALRTHREGRLSRTLSGVGALAAQHPWQRYGRLTSTFTPEELNRLLAPSFRRELPAIDPYDQLRNIWQHNSGTDPVNRMLAMDVGTYLPGDLLPKVDIATMAVSLEARSPLLDHEFMEWAAAVPGDLKVRSGTTKYLLKQALKPWLPEDLIHRKKMGFGIPAADWIAGPLKPMVHDLLLARDSGVSNYCDAAGVRALVEQTSHHRSGAGKVWSLLMLELWHREVLMAAQ